MLFQKRFHAGLRDGSITLTFRRWSTPKVRVGGRYRFDRTGTLEVEAIEEVAVGRISKREARLAGFEHRDELRALLERTSRSKMRDDTAVHRVAFRYVGEQDADPDDGADLSAAEVEALVDRLDRIDRRSGHGPWTWRTLALIRDQPRRRAAELASSLGRETPSFKADVRKLKALGLTRSREVGYELSPRGRLVMRKEATKRLSD